MRREWCITSRVTSRGESIGKGLSSPYSTNGEGVEIYKPAAVGQEVEGAASPSLCV
jgi:hypothetical protein